MMPGPATERPREWAWRSTRLPIRNDSAVNASPSRLPVTLALLALVTALAGCQTGRKADPPPPASPPPPPVSAIPESTKPAVPEGPALGTPAAKSQAMQLFRQSAEALNEGNEDAARRDIAEGQRLDPESKYGQCLARGLSADPEKLLGKASTKYTVRPNETLGRIAQRALGDSCEFYLLARYSGIRVPRQLAGGQVIRIPGRVALAPPDAVKPDTPPETPPGAIAPAAEAPPPKPSLSPQALRAAIDRRHREAQTAFRRQDLATAIREWDQVLALDPGNELARARRQEAIELDPRILEPIDPAA